MGPKRTTRDGQAMSNDRGRPDVTNRMPNLGFDTRGHRVMREIRALAALLRSGEPLAEGPLQQILTRECLEVLYGAPVQTITDASGTAFIPG